MPGVPSELGLLTYLHTGRWEFEPSMFHPHPYHRTVLRGMHNVSHIKSLFFLREREVWNKKAEAPLVQDWKKTAKNLHEAFYILDKISHKSNFSPPEGGVLAGSSARNDLQPSCHRILLRDQKHGSVRRPLPLPPPAASGMLQVISLIIYFHGFKL